MLGLAIWRILALWRLFIFFSQNGLVYSDVANLSYVMIYVHMVIGRVIPIETCVPLCPFVTADSPSVLTRSLTKFHTIKNRHSIPWLVLGVTIRQILSYFFARKVLVTAISPSILARSLQNCDAINIRHPIPWLLLDVTIRQIFSYFLAKNVQYCKILKLMDISAGLFSWIFLQ